MSAHLAGVAHGSALQPEPVLATREIQGNVLPGFGSRHVALCFVEIRRAQAAARWFSRLRVTSLADVLEAAAEPGGAHRAAGLWLNVAFSYRGLQRTFRDADALNDIALKEGLAQRSAMLGDPGEAHACGNCANWLVGRPDQPIDAVVLLGCEDRASLLAGLDALRRGYEPALATVFVQEGAKRPEPDAGREYFGYCDDISQPGVRGRLSEAPDDYLTPRANATRPDEGQPGQRLVWPGEFVFGYPAQDPLDRTRLGALAGAGTSWSANGSLLVFRRLRQDVAAFAAFLRIAAGRLAREHKELAGLTPELLAAKLMGRWRSGAPLLLASEQDSAAVARDGSRNNDFAYLARPAANGDGASHAGDPDGLVCPRAAHIRRAYPRDAATSGVTAANIETHRLLRRSIPYADGPERGLLFLAYQTSIERQFEFVTRAWLNNPHLHDTGDGQDPIAGQAFGTPGERERSFALPVARDGAIKRLMLTLPTDWVTPTGGGYFFVPSLSALTQLEA